MVRNTTGKTDIKLYKCKVYKEEGSYIIEAAIILPFVIAAILSLIIVIRNYQGNWKLNHEIKDEIALSVSRAYLISNDIFLKNRIENRADDVKIFNVKDIKVEKNLNLKGYDNLVKGQVFYTNRLKLPILNFKENDKVAVGLGRKFIGDKKTKKNMSFDEMEKEGDLDIVFIFPRDGARFHKSFCRIVSPKSENRVLTLSLMEKFSPCKVCINKKVSINSQVITFPGYGYSYHSKLCSLVIRNIEKTRRDIAIEKGYSPCKICMP